MGLKVSAREAARLSNRTERTIRRWVAEGRLPAEPVGLREPGPGVGPNRWLIDTDDLARMPGVTIDRARLAELQAQAALAGAGEDVLVRLQRIERDLADLRHDMRNLQRSMDDLREGRLGSTPKQG